MVLYPNKLPESERVCSGICTYIPQILFVVDPFWFVLGVVAKGCCKTEHYGRDVFQADAGVTVSKSVACFQID